MLSKQIYLKTCPCTTRCSVTELTANYKPTYQSEPITEATEAADLFRSIWDQDRLNFQEQVYALYLDQNNRVIGYRKLHTGATANTMIDKQILLYFAIHYLARGIILAHNHPSGKTNPSKADIMITKDIQQKCADFNIKLLDHIILTEKGFYSFQDDGLL